jgi:hypothetical protein
MEHDTEPEKSERELVEKQRWNHGIAPLHGGVMGIVSGCKAETILRSQEYTARGLVFRMSMGSFMGLGHDAHHGLSGCSCPSMTSGQEVSRPTRIFVHQRRSDMGRSGAVASENSIMRRARQNAMRWQADDPLLEGGAPPHVCACGSLIVKAGPQRSTRGATAPRHTSQEQNRHVTGKHLTHGVAGYRQGATPLFPPSACPSGA